MSKITQLELIQTEPENLEAELKAVREELTNVRRGLFKRFARLNDDMSELRTVVLTIIDELEKESHG